jgi:hypothetical protein
MDLLADFKQPESELMYRQSKMRQQNFEDCHNHNKKILFDKLDFEVDSEH